MNEVIYPVVIIGSIAAFALMALAMGKGRSVPVRKTLWILALVVLGLDTALHVVATVPALMDSGLANLWFLLGTLGFVAILVAAFLRPRWTGWALLVSAVVVPVMFAIGNLLGPAGPESGPPWAVAAIAYSVPALIAGVLLVLSMRRRSGDAAQADVGAPSLEGVEAERIDGPQSAHA